MSVDTNCISQPSASIHKMFIPVVEREVQEKIKNARPIYALPPSTTDSTSPDQSLTVRQSERLSRTSKSKNS